MQVVKSMFCEGAIKAWAVIAAGMSSLFLPILPCVLGLFAVILLDLYYGCKVARKYNQYILSKGLRWTAAKLRDVMLLIVCASIIDQHIITSINLHLVEFVAGAVSLNEMWSILESLMDLKPTGPWRLLKKIIRAKGEKYLDIHIDDKDLGLPQKRHYKLKKSTTKNKEVRTGNNGNNNHSSLLGMDPSEASD